MRNLGKAIACFKELGIVPRVDNFQSKLVMQKVFYLLQAMGMKTGFSYGLHVHGTYSPSLADELYNHQKNVEALKTDEKLSSAEMKLVEEFKEVMDEMKPAVLEIAATYAYLAYEKKLPPKEARIALKEMKPYFSETDFTIGINRAKELLFKPTVEDLKWLKKEMAPWEAASDETWRKMV